MSNISELPPDSDAEDLVVSIVMDLAEAIEDFGVRSSLQLMIEANPSPDYLAGYSTGVAMAAKMLRESVASWRTSQ